MRHLLISMALVLALVFVSCTEQQRTRTFGGESKVDLPLDKKLVMVTWKDNNLWFLLRNARPSEASESYIFSETSSWAFFEGTITIQEHIGTSDDPTAGLEPGIHVDLYNRDGPKVTIVDPSERADADDIKVVDQ